MVREMVPTISGGPNLLRYVVLRGDKKIGFVPPAKTVYFSYRKEVLHYSTKMRGYGIDADVVEWIDSQPNMERVVLVIDHEDGHRQAYVTPSILWLFHGRTVTLHPDFGPQVFATMEQIRDADRSMRSALSIWEDRLALEHYPPLEAVSV